ncbi:DUF2336 domain-containing protein [Aquibium sp. ELW1220]|uniref:DUF2336 domain-containing protein n=1 Tax=Aquibium sp. ELW1220 TaxID=2976766 RepID=UPI0025AF54C6|nr:DUF2336 domain-containing protein [Aquibium sp. ELW1220]MDN2582401.1 DUF2336 domain-containing protein [Aquibium sp. ELW1220]
MIVEHFIRWVATARVAERAAAANALARAYILSPMDFDERCAAEAALTMLLDDPSPKVRLAMAEPFSLSARAPQQIVAALAADQPEVAAPVLALSPLLSDNELIEHMAAGEAEAQVLIATRAQVSMALSAAIAEVACPAACAAVLGNSGAEIASISLRRMAERLGDDAAMREALIADRRLPCDIRHMLLLKVGDALRQSPLVRALMTQARADRMLREACMKASLTLIEHTGAEEHAALVEHLRLRGELTTGFLVRVVAHGRIDFFGAALVALSGLDQSRVSSLLSSGRDVALAALFRQARLPQSAGRVILRALTVWREVANGRRVAGTQEVSFLMLRDLDEAVRTGAVIDDKDALAGLLKAIHLDALRENAREHALAIAAA